MKRFIVVVLFLFLSLTIYGKEVSKIIASVNNLIITSKDLADYCKVIAYRSSSKEIEISPDDKDFKNEVLERLIEDKVILDEAKKENIEVPVLWVEDKFNKTVSSYPSREEFERTMVEEGVNITFLKGRIKEQYLMQNIIDKNVRSQINVSPHEVSRFYYDHLSEFAMPMRFIFWTAKSEDKKALHDIIKKIKEVGGEKISELYPDTLVRMESALAELKEEIAKTMEGMKEGDSLIQQVDNSLHLIYLEKIIPERTAALEESKEKIYAFLWDKKFKERFTEWVKELKQKAVIKIYPENTKEDNGEK